MAIWRLVTHHERPEEALQAYKRGLPGKGQFVALGWGATGDLLALRPANSCVIQRTILNANDRYPSYATLQSAISGGRCLWAFYNEMQLGDLVILSIGKGPLQDVCEVMGTYEWLPTPVFPGTYPNSDYQHIRRVKWRQDLDGTVIWRQRGGRPSLGWNLRWALIQL